MSDKHQKRTADFGFSKVAWEEKAQKVAEVFHSVADRYDVMNDLMSGGLHRLWKAFTLAASHVRPGQKVLDIAAGSGDLSAAFAKKVGSCGKVISLDINQSMLQVGRAQLLDRGIFNVVEFILADAEKLPLPDNHFDCVSIGFGLRNVTDKNTALAEMYRVLKPGGKALILEFSKPTSALLRQVVDWYTLNLIPKMGEFVVGDRDSYRYLAESIKMHPNQQTLATMMSRAGFEDVTYHNLTAGVVALHKGYKY